MVIIVGVTGGIAAYKSVHLVRLLVKAGHSVHVVPTSDSLHFVGLTTWEAISRNPVTTSVYEDVARVRHVALGRSADLIIVAPATANFLAKMAAGLADDLLGATLLAATAPVVVAPAMHTEMWQHPATVRNVATLRERGVRVVGPAEGELAGGDAGPGRMSEPEEILERALAACRPQDLGGLEVVVSAGGTREPIDPVRFIGNRSSGRQGVALARAAADRGARVTLVTAHVEVAVLADARHPGIRVVPAGTAAELQEAVRTASGDAQVVVMAAAVADYRPVGVSEAKLSKESSPGTFRTLELVQTDDVLAGLVAARRPGQVVVGFAAETVEGRAELLERGRRKLARKGPDLLVVNEVGWTVGFEAHDNAVVVLAPGGSILAEASGSKRQVAHAVWDAVVSLRAGNQG